MVHRSRVAPSVQTYECLTTQNYIKITHDQSYRIGLVGNLSLVSHLVLEFNPLIHCAEVAQNVMSRLSFSPVSCVCVCTRTHACALCACAVLDVYG